MGTLPTSDRNASSYNISVSASYSVCEHTFTWMTIGDLIDGTNYTVSVTAINCAGSSNSSMQCYRLHIPGWLLPLLGTEVTVSLQGLTSGQMYYCKAAATNTNSNNCTGPVVEV
ncbi:hypothetical protein EMCRGX_G026088 [Ephydatia muelleri]